MLNCLFLYHFPILQANSLIGENPHFLLQSIKIEILSHVWFKIHPKKLTQPSYQHITLPGI
jgi:hypothetical protein